MTQTVQPDRIILWVTAEDEKRLPQKVRALIGTRGFEVRLAPDWGSYKKIIPALLAFPQAYIATADDDAYYPANWLEGLVTACSPPKRQIICYRAHGMKIVGGNIAPYASWDYQAKSFGNNVLFPTGVGGVLYAPHALDPRVIDAELFTSLAPSADDVWLAWMGHFAKSEYVKLEMANRVVEWRGASRTSLKKYNVRQGGNDRQIDAMAKHFGLIARGNYTQR
ncbi:hypothetical protein [Aestuariivirga litoralis]|uniref:hypothetical protein n=1 Tax=Aestuariivirga litoralis TaxID=2650924 RepID=UPI001AEE611A|nr:hypothetical protein [Aestuariivirga litoralis]MBG1231361.1 glycosyltransferase family 2 protein [Aestuariivirga litoralis]